jgi:hypothetical protein
MKFSLKHWIGIILLVINQPFGWGALLICNVIAIHERNALFSLLGLGIYALSWGMLGLGFILAGPESSKYFRSYFKKLWGYTIHLFR